MSELPVQVRGWPAPRLLADANKAIAALPDDADVALIGYAEAGGGGVDVGVAVVANLGKGWKVVGRVDKPHGMELKGSVSVVKVWRRK